jgi:hypothetical protein
MYHWDELIIVFQGMLGKLERHIGRIAAVSHRIHAVILQGCDHFVLDCKVNIKLHDPVWLVV